MHVHEVVHQLAALVLVVSGAFFLAAAWLARKKALVPDRRAQPQAGVLRQDLGAWAVAVVVGALALGAAAIHAAAAANHLDGHALHGASLGVVAVAQLGIALAAATGRVLQVKAGALFGTVVVIGAWAASRTVGLPIGPDGAWQTQPVGLADATATAFELILVTVLALGVRRDRAVPRDTRLGEALSIGVIPLVGVLGIVALIAVASLDGGSGGGHVHAAAALATPA